MEHGTLSNAELDTLEDLLRRSRENRDKITRLIKENDEIAKQTEEILKRTEKAKKLAS